MLHRDREVLADGFVVGEPDMLCGAVQMMTPCKASDGRSSPKLTVMDRRERRGSCRAVS
jgi:hypothetical protein